MYRVFCFPCLRFIVFVVTINIRASVSANQRQRYFSNLTLLSQFLYKLLYRDTFCYAVTYLSYSLKFHEHIDTVSPNYYSSELMPRVGTQIAYCLSSN